MITQENYQQAAEINYQLWREADAQTRRLQAELDVIAGTLDKIGIERGYSVVERVGQWVDRENGLRIKMAAIHRAADESRELRITDLRKLLTNIQWWSKVDGG